MIVTLPKQSADAFACYRESVQALLDLVTRPRPVSPRIIMDHLADLLADIGDLESDVLCDMRHYAELAARWELDDQVVIVDHVMQGGAM